MSSMETILQHSVPRLRGVRQLVGILVRRLMSWIQVSRSRRQLLELTDRELEDLNLTREAAVEEARRPFWDSRSEHRGWH
ncbi:MAG: DUF1127 domain-containing protein [Roseibium sp.]|uniref:DUF1127 domain-containing protein n=1 Tax=Roseibium sp. TaxID=1936156 RepID=UPI002631C113|nr:DUF1127 domain-containing protein [Roseibium sp.]MCV0426917.1 DUF1127 domain-containing protein [Roseibium sp.]